MQNIKCYSNVKYWYLLCELMAVTVKYHIVPAFFFIYGPKVNCVCELFQMPFDN